MEVTTPSYDECTYFHFLPKPMFELFCISIHSKPINDDPKLNSLHDGKSCDIHGKVHVVDQDENKFDFYNRKIDNLETINLGGFLSLNTFPIVLSKPILTIAVMLYDTAHDVEIANNVFDIDYRKMYDYDQLHMEKIDGQYGFACVYYATFQHCKIASINKVAILRNYVSGGSLNADIFGTIIARLERKHKTSRSDVPSEFEFPPIMLFDNQVKETKSNSTQAVLDLDTPINLLRSYIVVPFNCSLIIEADFCDTAGNKVVMNMHLNLYPASLNKHSARYRNFEMQIQVGWFDGYAKFPWDVKVEDTLDAKQDESQRSSQDQQSSGIVCRGQPCAAVPILSSCVEVFSVLICVDDNDLDIWGSIQMSDSECCPFYIFNGHESLYDRKTISIVGPLRCFNDKPLSICVNLKDGKGRIVSKGSFKWDGNDNGSTSLYDRRICTVIPGDIGYAAIHYSMITYGAHVGLRMVFLSQYSTNAFVEVYGTVTATYRNYEYPTLYDQELYQTTLFSKRREERVRIKLARKSLPLLKHVVSVPLQDSLILNVNLKIIGPIIDGEEMIDDNTDRIVVIERLVEFNADVGRSHIISRGSYFISICTDVSKVRDESPSEMQCQCRMTQRFIKDQDT